MTHATSSPFMRLRADRPIVRPTRCSREWEKGTCRSSSTRFLPRWRWYPAAPSQIARSAVVGTPSGSWRHRLRMVACSASTPIGRPSRRRIGSLRVSAPEPCCARRISRQLYDVATDAGFIPLDAVLFDLGISSYQLADPRRGFSFAADAPPDMRFDEERGLSALDLVDRSSQRELAGILATFGEERRAGRIAKAILAARAEGRLVSAADWRGRRGCRPGRGADRAASIPPRAPSRRCASRSTTSSRCSLPALAGALAALRPGGRLAVIGYHSGEDRIVKRSSLARAVTASRRHCRRCAPAAIGRSCGPSPGGASGPAPTRSVGIVAPVALGCGRPTRSLPRARSRQERGGFPSPRTTTPPASRRRTYNSRQRELRERHTTRAMGWGDPASDRAGGVRSSSTTPWTSTPPESWAIRLLARRASAA